MIKSSDITSSGDEPFAHYVLWKIFLDGHSWLHSIYVYPKHPEFSKIDYLIQPTSITPDFEQCFSDPAFDIGRCSDTKNNNCWDE